MDKRVLEWWLIGSPLAVKTNIAKGADFSKWDMGAMLRMKYVFSPFFGFDELIRYTGLFWMSMSKMC